MFSFFNDKSLVKSGSEGVKPLVVLKSDGARSFDEWHAAVKNTEPQIEDVKKAARIVNRSRVMTQPFQRIRGHNPSDEVLRYSYLIMLQVTDKFGVWHSEILDDVSSRYKMDSLFREVFDSFYDSPNFEEWKSSRVVNNDVCFPEQMEGSPFTPDDYVA